MRDLLRQAHRTIRTSESFQIVAVYSTVAVILLQMALGSLVPSLLRSSYHTRL